MRRRQSRRVYWAYGLRLGSPWPLPCPEETGPGPVDVELWEVPARFFARAVRSGPGASLGDDDWFHYRRLPDGSEYLRWSGLSECLVSADGRRMACHRLRGASPEAFYAYLLGQVLSFALLKRGIEPLHATCVAVDGGAVGFLGECGRGKSTLGAAFLRAGHALVTDDLLVVKPHGASFLAYAGIPRIKLFPEIGRRLLGGRASGTPMNGFTPKLVIPLGDHALAYSRRPVPLKALYVLAPPTVNGRTGRIAIRPLTPRRAFVELIRNTFNTVVADPARLQRQFDLAARIARSVPVHSLAFPRTVARLEAVREAIRADLAP